MLEYVLVVVFFGEKPYLVSCSAKQLTLSSGPQVSVCSVKWCHLQVVCPCHSSVLARRLRELQQWEDSSRKAGPVMWHPGEGRRGSPMSGGRVLGLRALWLVKWPSDRFKSPTEAACSLSAINTAGSSAGILDGSLLTNMFFCTAMEVFFFIQKKIM